MEPSQGIWQDAQFTVHESCELFFFVSNTCLGSVPFDPGMHPEFGYNRHSIAYFCPVCGQVWGRILMLNCKKESTPWTVTFVECEQHGGGSFLDGHRAEGYLYVFPEKVLRRELLLHTKGMIQ